MRTLRGGKTGEEEERIEKERTRNKEKKVSQQHRACYTRKHDYELCESRLSREPREALTRKGKGYFLPLSHSLLVCSRLALIKVHENTNYDNGK